jgi:hypothetical protein
LIIEQTQDNHHYDNGEKVSEEDQDTIAVRQTHESVFHGLLLEIFLHPTPSKKNRKIMSQPTLL